MSFEGPMMSFAYVLHLLVNHSSSKIKKAPNRTSFTEIAPLTPIPLASPSRAAHVLLVVSDAASVLAARVWHCCAFVQDRAHRLS
ncbi:hypothetical protein ACSQ67_022801 [Phaseolus vulgaris]